MPWEETDTQIRHQLLDPDGFQDKSFRTIPIKKDKPRIWGIIGKLKGKTTTTLQALRFPKEDGWTMAKAKEWVKGHGDRLKEAVMFEDKATKDFLFEVKEVTEAGEFTGILSVYDVVDLGGDLVEPGAFVKTLQESGGTVPCMWQHRDPIGLLKIHDTGTALEVKGKLVMEVTQAREAHALMMAGVVKGLSIGFKTVKSKIEEGVRRLKELALYEGSIVTFPMLPLAQVTSVKSEDKGDFMEEFERAQTFAARSMMISSLWTALDSLCWDHEMDDAERIKASAETIDQFRKAYIEFLPKLFVAMGGKEDIFDEAKAGRTISTATASKLKEIMKICQALLGEEAAGTSQPDEGKQAADTTAAGAAAQYSGEPDSHGEHHSALKILGEVKEKILWN